VSPQWVRCLATPTIFACTVARHGSQFLKTPMRDEAFVDWTDMLRRDMVDRTGYRRGFITLDFHEEMQYRQYMANAAF